MPDESHRIEALETRVERIEDCNRTDIAAIHAKLDGLTTLINSVLVGAAKSACPSPGACITLAEKLTSQITAHNATMLRVERLELKLMEVEKWQWKFVGALSAVIFIATMFGPALRKLFKLE